MLIPQVLLNEFMLRLSAQVPRNYPRSPVLASTTSPAPFPLDRGAPAGLIKSATVRTQSSQTAESWGLQAFRQSSQLTARGSSDPSSNPSS